MRDYFRYFMQYLLFPGGNGVMTILWMLLRRSFKTTRHFESGGHFKAAGNISRNVF